MFRRTLFALAAVAATATWAAPGPDPVAAVNSVRRQGCAVGAASVAALVRDRRLDDAARRVAAGEPLRAAVDATTYRAARATVVQVDGARDETELARVIGQSCGQVADAALRHAGAFRDAGAVWIVLAEPFTAPTLDRAHVQERVLALVNAARARPRRCGDQDFGSAAPLRWSAALQRAASRHARDMAERGRLGHAGSDGSSASQRVSQAGYVWSAVGENVAAGQRDADAVVRSWLASPGHCANLMSGEFTEVGLAFATNDASDLGIYWAQVFGAPLEAAPRAPAARRSAPR
jgi:uncharacterized protein YkwD